MTAHPFDLKGPAAITLQPNAAGTFTVINEGTQPLTVRESLGRYTVRSLRFPAASHATLTTFSKPWITVSPQVFTLRPGQAETVHIASAVPAGTQGNHYLSVLWSAAAPHGAGALHLAGAIATTVTIPDPGTAHAVTSAGMPRPGAVQHGGGLGTIAEGIGAIMLVIVIIACIVLNVRHYRRRAAHRKV